MFLGLVVLILPLKAQTVSFDEALQVFLAEKGFHGKVLDLKKDYDEDDFIENFSVLLEENQKQEERTAPQMFLGVTSSSHEESMTIKILNKDIQNFPYMKYDWIARLVVKLAIDKVSRILSLPYKTTNKNGVYHTEILPAMNTIPSRYRFEQLDVNYSVNNLILDIEIVLRGSQNFLLMEYVRGYVNAILRMLENGHIPGTTAGVLTQAQAGSGVSVKSFGSNDLIQQFLAPDESSLFQNEKPLLRPFQKEQESNF